MEAKIVSMFPNDWNTIFVDGNTRQLSGGVRYGLKKIMMESSERPVCKRSRPLAIVFYFTNGDVVQKISRKRTQKRKSVASNVDKKPLDEHLVSQSSSLEKTNEFTPVNVVRRLSIEYDISLPSQNVEVDDLVVNSYDVFTQTQGTKSDVSLPSQNDEVDDPIVISSDASAQAPSMEYDVTTPTENDDKSNLVVIDSVQFPRKQSTECQVLMERLNIVSISTKLPATTESDCHYKKNVTKDISDERFENENLEDEDIEPEYISDMRKNNAKIVEKYDREIKYLKETINELQKKVDRVLDEREKTRQLLEKKLEKEIIKWKKSNSKKLKRLTRRC